MSAHAHHAQTDPTDVVSLHNPQGTSPVLLVCEHASNHIPDEFDGLGLDAVARESHVAWDPGAFDVASEMSRLLDAPLVASNVSRLVYDCNRPPDAPDAMPARSELFDIPGNSTLSARDRARRVASYYDPFRELLNNILDSGTGPRVLITVHSFTPVYMGKPRDVELGILHDEDSRMADEMLRLAPEHCRMKARRNTPYGPADGVTHTLKEHALSRDLPNVMLEIRNDLIADPTSQKQAAERLSSLIGETLETLDIPARQEARP